MAGHGEAHEEQRAADIRAQAVAGGARASGGAQGQGKARQGSWNLVAAEGAPFSRLPPSSRPYPLPSTRPSLDSTPSSALGARGVCSHGAWLTELQRTLVFTLKNGDLRLHDAMGFFALLVVLSFTNSALALNNGVGQLPEMGFNSCKCLRTPLVPAVPAAPCEGARRVTDSPFPLACRVRFPPPASQLPVG